MRQDAIYDLRSRQTEKEQHQLGRMAEAKVAVICLRRNLSPAGPMVLHAPIVGEPFGKLR